jgi:protoporphyrinogen oxidase
MHAAKKIAARDVSLGQKETETTLIERFLYPKYGPGQMWETVAKSIKEKGGEIFLNHEVVGITANGEKISGVTLKTAEGKLLNVTGDYFFSSMPVKDLIRALDARIPKMVRNVAEGLVYRDFLVVGLLLKKLKIKNETKRMTLNNIIPDNWIYVQENDVKVGRIQVFNNWSPYMVADSDNVWLGLEYFCNEGDGIWSRPAGEMAALAAAELEGLGIADRGDVLDSTVIKMKKAYPAYFGRYDDFDAIREFTDRYENLFLIGRNGMHRYNNQDHSMLTAITAADNIVNGIKEKDNIWQVNTEQEYHESK